MVLLETFRISSCSIRSSFLHLLVFRQRAWGSRAGGTVGHPGDRGDTRHGWSEAWGCDEEEAGLRRDPRWFEKSCAPKDRKHSSKGRGNGPVGPVPIEGRGQVRDWQAPREGLVT